MSESESETSAEEASRSEEDSTSSDDIQVEKVKVKKTKAISDEKWIQDLSERERMYYESKKKSEEEMEDLKVNCTACFKQVNHKVRVSISDANF